MRENEWFCVKKPGLRLTDFFQTQAEPGTARAADPSASSTELPGLPIGVFTSFLYFHSKELKFGITVILFKCHLSIGLKLFSKKKKTLKSCFITFSYQIPLF